MNQLSPTVSERADDGLSIDQTTGDVSLDVNPDHELKTSYSFTVIATDSEGNVDDQLVTVTVNNLDDAAPTISSGETATAIDENSGAGQEIYNATADDSGDISDGFTFSLGDDSQGLSIDEDNGIVTTNDSFVADFEENETQTFAVFATDAAGNASEAQSVMLSINNLDEVAPTITSDTAADAINENTGEGQLIYTATADDSLDISAGVTFSLAEGSDPDLTIDATSGEVTLTVDPNYEGENVYNFAIIATDAEGNASDAKPITLSINNLDDTAPTITSGNSIDAIDENVIEGAFVYDAAADDSADVESSIPVVFSLTPESDANLQINSATGVVTLAISPDHELQSNYSFGVIATDAKGNVSETKALTFTINDLDDAAPTIISGEMATAIDENSSAGQVIYQALADDGGDDIAAQPVTFSLAVGSDLALSIDSASGKVTLTDDPDHETQNQYSFAVIATDGATNASNAQSVTLSINDLDEVAPIITSATVADAIDENTGAGQIIYTATADDSQDISAGVTFSLGDGSDSALSIDSATGEVTLATDPDHEVQSQYSFAVIATDGAGNVSDAQSVTLSINNLDEVAPTITSATVADAIDENSGAGTVIYTATAIDSNTDVVATPIIYSLAEDSDPALTIDASYR
jgi:hypothetical protein